MSIKNKVTGELSNITTYDPVTGVISGISVTGNLFAGNYVLGDGGLLSNIATYGNSNVANFLTTYTGNINSANISVTNTANLGNFTIYDQTISGTIVDRDIVIRTLGNANIEMIGSFHVHSSGNIELPPEFVIAPDGQTSIYVPSLDANAGAVEIVGSTSGEVVPLGNPGGMLHITGQNNEASRLYNDGVSNYPLYVGRRFNGTALAPTGVLQNQVISRIGANPYLIDAPGFAPLGVAQINFIATEDQTTTAQGSRIAMNVTPGGSNVQAVVASFDTSGIELTGNLIPSVDNTYSLGNITNRWIGAYFGNAGIYVQDTALATTGQLSLDNGVFIMDGNISAVQIGTANAIQLTTNGLVTSVSTRDITIGTVGDAGNTAIKNAGIKFNDGSVQTTAAIPVAEKGVAFGVVPLDASTKIDPIYLPSGAITFKGIWDAANNTPTLADGVGASGDEYIVGTAGTQDLGSGNISFAVGDFVLYTAANVWVDVPVGGSGVQSFNSRTGIVTLNNGDVINALSSGSIVNSKLANSNVTITTGGGLTGGGTVNLGGTLTLVANVSNIVAGTGVTVTPSTGTYTIAIGQAVGTANSVQFSSVTSTTTIQATGNITGGNLTTGGQVVATGNITTAGYFKTPNTSINTGVVTTGNVNGGNLIGQNLTPTRVTFVGSGKEIDDDAEFTYNDTTNTLSVGNISASGNVTAAYFSGNGAGLTNTVGGSRYFGSFLSTTTQTNTSVGNALPMTFDTADPWNAGVQIGSPTPNSHIIINNPGVYNLQFSAQLDKTDSGTDTVDIWLSQDGINVPNTNTTVTLSGNSDKVVAAWNFLVLTTVANSYFQLYWTSTDADARIFAQGTQINPTRPAIPAVILTVTQA